MTEKDELILVFAELAATVRVEGDPVARVHSRAARVRRRRHQRGVVAGVCFVATAVTTGLVAVPGSHDRRAFADWTPLPSLPSTAEQGQAIRGCHQFVRQADDVGRAAAKASAKHYTPIAVSDLRPIAVERRGQETLTLLASKRAFASCFGESDGSGGIFAGVTPPRQPHGDEARTVSAGGTSTNDSPPAQISMIAGQAGPLVSSVEIVRTDGVVVRATLKSGWFFAWWPTSAGAKSLRITDRDGTAHTASAVAPN
jgi:hypothetical protein